MTKTSSIKLVLRNQADCRACPVLGSPAPFSDPSPPAPFLAISSARRHCATGEHHKGLRSGHVCRTVIVGAINGDLRATYQVAPTSFAELGQEELAISRQNGTESWLTEHSFERCPLLSPQGVRVGRVGRVDTDRRHSTSRGGAIFGVFRSNLLTLVRIDLLILCCFGTILVISAYEL